MYVIPVFVSWESEILKLSVPLFYINSALFSMFPRMLSALAVRDPETMLIFCERLAFSSTNTFPFWILVDPVPEML